MSHLTPLRQTLIDTRDLLTGGSAAVLAGGFGASASALALAL